jgi:hypothetical protein
MIIAVTYLLVLSAVNEFIISDTSLTYQAPKQAHCRHLSVSDKCCDEFIISDTYVSYIKLQEASWIRFFIAVTYLSKQSDAKGLIN